MTNPGYKFLCSQYCIYLTYQNDIHLLVWITKANVCTAFWVNKSTDFLQNIQFLPILQKIQIVKVEQIFISRYAVTFHSISCFCVQNGKNSLQIPEIPSQVLNIFQQGTSQNPNFTNHANSHEQDDRTLFPRLPIAGSYVSQTLSSKIEFNMDVTYLW